MARLTLRFAGLAVALAVWLVPLHAEAHLALEQNLQIGPLPQGAGITFGPLDARAARLAARLAGALPCAGTSGTFEFTDLPAELTSDDGGTVPLVWSGSSARAWEASDPGQYVEFHPASQIGELPVTAFPATLGLGAGVAIPEQAPTGTYHGSARVQFTWQMDTGGGCLTRTFDRWIEISVIVQGRLVVTAEDDVIDLGILVPGMEMEIAADGSGPVGPASFVVTGPESLDLRLSVGTTDLAHETEADVLPLVFTGGLQGRETPPGMAFSSGDVVAAGDHGGGPLYVRCGFRVSVPPEAREGPYRGEIVLSVEVILN